jgi:hypothetical protein
LEVLKQTGTITRGGGGSGDGGGGHFRKLQADVLILFRSVSV